MMHENEFILRLMSRFEGYELVELLDIPVEEVIDAFMSKIDDCREDLEEFLINGK